MMYIFRPKNIVIISRIKILYIYIYPNKYDITKNSVIIFSDKSFAEKNAS